MLGREIGSLEKGKRADIILVNLAKAHYAPVLWKPKPNAIANFVYSGSGEDVDTTIVDGRILMEHRKLTTLDEAAIMRKATGAAERVQERSGLGKRKTPWHWSK
jgi:5-methylthioadenosine/S-adenosylhomocysteine deaminase